MPNRQRNLVIVRIAVPRLAACIVGGTIGLALSRAFEAAYVPQTVIGLSRARSRQDSTRSRRSETVAETPMAKTTGWVKAMDFGRQTQQLGSLDQATDSRYRHPRMFAARPFSSQLPADFRSRERQEP